MTVRISKLRCSVIDMTIRLSDATPCPYLSPFHRQRLNIFQINNATYELHGSLIIVHELWSEDCEPCVTARHLTFLRNSVFILFNMDSHNTRVRLYSQFNFHRWSSSFWIVNTFSYSYSQSTIWSRLVHLILAYRGAIYISVDSAALYKLTSVIHFLESFLP